MKYKYVISIILTIIIGVFLLSSLVIFINNDDDLFLFGLVNCNYIDCKSLLSLVTPLFFIISLSCGSLAVFLTDIKKISDILYTTLVAGFFTTLFYVLVTVIVNQNYKSTSYIQNAFWGSTGMEIFTLLFIGTSFFIMPSFIIGGFIPSIYQKIITSRKK